jgi:hypothetical protein
LTFYQEDDERALDDLRRRNRRWIIGIFSVVALMVISVAIGAAAASRSHSDDHAAGDNTGQSVQAGANQTPTTKANATGATHRRSTKPTTRPTEKSSATSRATLPNRGTLPSDGTLPRTVTPVSPATPITTATHASPATTTTTSPDLKNPFVAAYRGECQNIWSHADADGLLWDPDAPGSAPFKVSECYAAMPDASGLPPKDGVLLQAFARGDADSAVEGMTVNNRLRSTKGVLVDLP